jgi:peptidyl-prolyl cis-trans isomerase A (cyclophilin A)
MPSATFITSAGSFTVELMPKHAPQTVENFVALATGAKEWRDPRDGSVNTGALYPGTIFHRVIDGFMIQGGDPSGTGTGGTGYTFVDECPSDGPGFDQPGRLAMANSGPNTNGSQFFITVAETPWLNGRHTIFGQVVRGYEVVDAISKMSTDGHDRPSDDIVIQSIDVIDD